MSTYCLCRFIGEKMSQTELLKFSVLIAGDSCFRCLSQHENTHILFEIIYKFIFSISKAYIQPTHRNIDEVINTTVHSAA